MQKKETVQLHQHGNYMKVEVLNQRNSEPRYQDEVGEPEKDCGEISMHNQLNFTSLIMRIITYTSFIIYMI